MPVSESQVGITQFISSHSPFRAILKQTVDDFVVNEILLSGKVARVTHLPCFTPKKRSPTHNTPSVEINASTVDFSTLDVLLPSATPASPFVIPFLNANERSPVTLPACNDKAVRTKIHAWFRDNISSVVTDTVETPEGKSIRIRQRGSCRPWKRRRTNRGTRPSDAGNDNTFDPRESHIPGVTRLTSRTRVSFLLWKQNRDTTDALASLARMLHIPPSAFSYAGTKDKRAVTTQLVHARGLSESSLAYANRTLQRQYRGGRMLVANYRILSEDEALSVLRLGDLKGNRFTLALRDLELVGDPHSDFENVKVAVNSVRTRGFVNYFGLQRFGSGVSPTHETGFAFLRGDFEEVCRRILLPLKVGEHEKDGMRPDRQRFVSSMERFARKEASARQVLHDIPAWMHVEKAVIESFVDDEKRKVGKYDYKKAFSRLPRNLRRMYGHAVQSYLWNVMASERICRARPDVEERMFAIAGDLILEKEDSVGEFNHETKVRSVTEEEEREKSISVYRVLIPVVGSLVPLPETGYEMVKKILVEQKVDLEKHQESEYGMKGTYRRLLAKPEDVEMEIVTYKDRYSELIPSNISKLLMESTRQDKSVGNETKSETINGGAERKNKCGEEDDLGGKDTDALKEEAIALDNGQHKAVRPQTCETGVKVVNTENKIEEIETQTYASQKKVDVKPDESHIIEDRGVVGYDTNDANGLADVAGDIKGDSDVNKDVSNKENDVERKALILSFSLGCAEYATMLVRELTGQDSSTANQKRLQGAADALKHKELDEK